MASSTNPCCYPCAPDLWVESVCISTNPSSISRMLMSRNTYPHPEGEPFQIFCQPWWLFQTSPGLSYLKSRRNGRRRWIVIIAIPQIRSDIWILLICQLKSKQNQPVWLRVWCWQQPGETCRTQKPQLVLPFHPFPAKRSPNGGEKERNAAKWSEEADSWNLIRSNRIHFTSFSSWFPPLF